MGLFLPDFINIVVWRHSTLKSRVEYDYIMTLDPPYRFSCFSYPQVHCWQLVFKVFWSVSLLSSTSHLKGPRGICYFSWFSSLFFNQLHRYSAKLRWLEKFEILGSEDLHKLNVLEVFLYSCEWNIPKNAALRIGVLPSKFSRWAASGFPLKIWSHLWRGMIISMKYVFSKGSPQPPKKHIFCWSKTAWWFGGWRFFAIFFSW